MSAATGTASAAWPLSRMRRVIRRRMTESVVTKPHVTLHAVASADGLRAAAGPGAGMTALIVKTAATVLTAHPRLNAWLTDEGIVEHSRVDVAVAVDIGDGLVAPIVRDCATRPATELHAELGELAERARAGRVRAEDLDGATFTVSTLGRYGVQQFTPIISPPQVAILGVGAIEALPVPGVGETRLHLSLSFDHGAVDGAPAARFLQDLCRAVEAIDSTEGRS